MVGRRTGALAQLNVNPTGERLYLLKSFRRLRATDVLRVLCLCGKSRSGYPRLLTQRIRYARGLAFEYMLKSNPT